MATTSSGSASAAGLSLEAPSITAPQSTFTLAELGARPELLCVLDLEGTCDWPAVLHRIQPREIIQFGAVMIDVREPASPFIVTEPDAAFDVLVRPAFHPKLSSFCVELVKTNQQAIDTKGVVFEEAMLLFHRWLKRQLGLDKGRGGYDYECREIARRVVFMTLGQWDLGEEIPLECARRELPTPPYLRRWLNLQPIARKALKLSHTPGMEVLMSQLRLPMTGAMHCAVDDAKNTAAVVVALMRGVGNTTGQTAADVGAAAVAASATSREHRPPHEEASSRARQSSRGSGGASNATTSNKPLWGYEQLLRERPYSIDDGYIEGVVMRSHALKEKARRDRDRDKASEKGER